MYGKGEVEWEVASSLYLPEISISLFNKVFNIMAFAWNNLPKKQVIKHSAGSLT